MQFAEGGDGSQIRVSILSPRADISLETGTGNTLVKRKKGGLQNLWGPKSDRQSVALRTKLRHTDKESVVLPGQLVDEETDNKSGAPTNLKHPTSHESSGASSMRDNDESLREEAEETGILWLQREISSPSFSGPKRLFLVHRLQ